MIPAYSRQIKAGKIAAPFRLDVDRSLPNFESRFFRPGKFGDELIFTFPIDAPQGQDRIHFQTPTSLKNSGHTVPERKSLSVEIQPHVTGERQTALLGIFVPPALLSENQLSPRRCLVSRKVFP